MKKPDFPKMTQITSAIVLAFVIGYLTKLADAVNYWVVISGLPIPYPIILAIISWILLLISLKIIEWLWDFIPVQREKYNKWADKERLVNFKISHRFSMGKLLFFINCPPQAFVYTRTKCEIRAIYPKTDTERVKEISIRSPISNLANFSIHLDSVDANLERMIKSFSKVNLTWELNKKEYSTIWVNTKSPLSVFKINKKEKVFSVCSYVKGLSKRKMQSSIGIVEHKFSPGKHEFGLTIIGRDLFFRKMKQEISFIAEYDGEDMKITR